MVITVTLNPALDRALEVKDFRVGDHARAVLRALVPAGKGINVARGVARLGGRATACALVGRGEMERFRAVLEADGASHILCAVRGVTRTNTTILDPAGGTTTHLREEGFTVRAAELERLRRRLVRAVAEARAAGPVSVAFCGSLPRGLKTSDWLGLLAACRRAGASVLVDTSGEPLRAALQTCWTGCAWCC